LERRRKDTGFFTVYTIGHSDLQFTEFAERLLARGVDMVVDARSYPYSSYAEWFNRDRVEYALRKHGIEYLFMGSRLGALTEDGRFDFIRREKDPEYQEGVKELLGLAERYRIAVMTSEGDYMSSHRHHLIAQTLLRLRVEVVHITESDADAPAQADLFHAVAEED
jgi:uncharacterized protein (DUF488 family)